MNDKLLTPEELKRIAFIAKHGSGKFDCQTVKKLTDYIEMLADKLNRTGARAILEGEIARSMQQSEASLYERLEKAEAKLDRIDAQAGKSIGTVRVTHEGYSMVLSTYVAYALTEGIHEIYAAPPAPAVPEEKSTDIDYAYKPLSKAFNEGWNACRAAMLVKQPVSDKPAAIPVPDGWQLVPVEPTQEMVDAHFEGVISGGFHKGYRNMLAATPSSSPEDASNANN
jgi:hypothetical protein